MTVTVERADVLHEQIMQFAALGEVGPNPASYSEDRVALELTAVLMRDALCAGPLARIKALNRLLRIVKQVTKLVTGERDRIADSLTSVWSYRRLADLLGVRASTMQGWCMAGRTARPE